VAVRVHAHLAGLRHIEFAGAAGDPGCEQWQAWERLQASGAKEIWKDFDLPPVGAAWNSIVSDLDPQSRYRAFEASTMMALRKSLRRGSTWVNHSITFRARESMLIADADWDGSKELHHQILGLPSQAMAFLEPILAGVSVGLTALAEAAGRHRWTARVDPQRRTHAAGLTTHVRERWGLFYDQPTLLNDR